MVSQQKNGHFQYSSQFSRPNINLIFLKTIFLSEHQINNIFNFNQNKTSTSTKGTTGTELRGTQSADQSTPLISRTLRKVCRSTAARKLAEESQLLTSASCRAAVQSRCGLVALRSSKVETLYFVDSVLRRLVATYISVKFGTFRHSRRLKFQI